MNIIKINPVGKRVVIKAYESAKTSSSGLIVEHINSNTSGGKVLGTIVEVSPESEFKDKLGRLVFWRRYSMDELKYIDPDGEQMVTLVDDQEVLAFPEMR